MKGTLYIVSTPIGNLEDITLRALKVLEDVDLIAAEDTRHSLKLLTHYGIKKPLMSYWSEREKIRAGEIITKLKDGLSVGLISDAGTPGISDPGAVIVRSALEEHIEVVSIPGASAVISALSISGLPTEEFTFIGFLPPKRGERMKALNALLLEARTLVFYEAPHRLIETLSDMEETLGAERRMALAKELTKMHEEVLRGTITQVLEGLTEEHTKIAGEYVLVLEGKKKGEKPSEVLEEALLEVKTLMKKGMGRKEAAKNVAENYGISKKDLYDRSLE